MIYRFEGFYELNPTEIKQVHYLLWEKLSKMFPKKGKLRKLTVTLHEEISEEHTATDDTKIEYFNADSWARLRAEENP